MRAVATVAVLTIAWAAFTLASPSAGVASLWLLARGDALWKERFRQADKAFAGLIGWGDEYTVSACCGSSARRDCRFCLFVCWLLEWRWPAHCAQQARAEGLL